MRISELNNKINIEIDHAISARAGGLEGQARVCARRAAGLAVRAYLEKQGVALSNPSVIDLLNLFEKRPEISAEMRLTTGHLLARVNQDYTLDPAVDLIAETRWLVDSLDTME